MIYNNILTISNEFIKIKIKMVLHLQTISFVIFTAPGKKLAWPLN